MTDANGKMKPGSFPQGKNYFLWPLPQNAGLSESLKKPLPSVPVSHGFLTQIRPYSGEKNFSDWRFPKKIPIMEDANLMHRMKRSGQGMAIFSEKIPAMRWEKAGICYETLTNRMLISFLGQACCRRDRHISTAKIYSQIMSGLTIAGCSGMKYHSLHRDWQFRKMKNGKE